MSNDLISRQVAIVAFYESKDCDISTVNLEIFAGIFFGIMILSVFYFFVTTVYRYEPKILYDGDKTKRRFYKDKPVIFHCDYCDCFFEVKHMSELREPNDEGEYSCRCPQCSNTANGRYVSFSKYITQKRELQGITIDNTKP